MVENLPNIYSPLNLEQEQGSTEKKKKQQTNTRTSRITVSPAKAV